MASFTMNEKNKKVRRDQDILIDGKLTIEDEDSNSINDNASDMLSSFSGDDGDEESNTVMNHPTQNVDNIAGKETQAIHRYKVLVIVLLLLPTAMIACGVYFFTKLAEQEEFESQFYDDASKILESIGKRTDVLLEATESLVVAMVSYAHSTNQKWPYVTLPDFGTRTSIIRRLADTTWICLYPYVAEEERYEWEKYSSKNNYWVSESIGIQQSDANFYGPIVWEYENWDVIHDYGEYEKAIPGIEGTNKTGPYYPSWQNSPVVPYYAPYNWDLSSIEDVGFFEINMIEHKAVISYPYLGQIYDDPNNAVEVEEMGYEVDWIKDYIHPDDEADEPVADLIYPIITERDGSNIVDGNYEPSDHNHQAVGLFSITYYWRAVMKDILPTGSNGLVVVFDSCKESFTYQINGAKTLYLGVGDRHQLEYDKFELTSKLTDLTNATNVVPIADDYCPYNIRIYPSDTFRDLYSSQRPIIITCVTVVIFALLHTLVFLSYDKLVQHRNKLVMRKATRSRAVVASLFPDNVADKLLGDDEASQEITGSTFLFQSPKQRVESFLKDDGEGEGGQKNLLAASKPIAEVYPNTTCMFADVAGFSAWSSAREPFQVFTFLETLYGSFDDLARRKGVFKVEAVGDAYVAVSGLPNPRSNHAVVMAKFAAGCRSAMNHVTHRLEVSLGPGTGDLRMRFGLHSGSVTAGVLRGEKARFQLFGNTVNTAAQMQSTGEPNQIHISKKTADLLIEHGKRDWLQQRKHQIDVKGLGLVQTYFVFPKAFAGSVTSASAASTVSHNSFGNLTSMKYTHKKLDRLVTWMGDVFGNLLKNILASRPKRCSKQQQEIAMNLHLERDELAPMVRDEVINIIELPEFDSPGEAENREQELVADEIELSSEVVSELRHYITEVALRYRSNHFHNFEHACQVTMATKKLLSRVVAPNDVTIECEKDLHDCTYGITSDPLTKFAVVFAALIHDVDHPGVSNQQLVVEQTPEAIRYKNLSVSEQNSVDVAWDLLMGPEYENLRGCICSNLAELKRFRQLLVNAVMATDIFDKELKALRDSRWETAFDEETELKEKESAFKMFSNRRATIVIEHIIQASDIAHCMQHWKVYQKWNKRLFQEMHVAYKEGRNAKDPAEGWHGGELWFYDNYIIPLAAKLKECGVFGVSCDEFLDYAIDNRNEWERRGRDIVREMAEEVNNAAALKIVEDDEDDEQEPAVCEIIS